MAILAEEEVRKTPFTTASSVPVYPPRLSSSSAKSSQITELLRWTFGEEDSIPH